MNEGIHLDLDTWIVPGQIRKANLCRGLGNRYTTAGTEETILKRSCYSEVQYVFCAFYILVAARAGLCSLLVGGMLFGVSGLFIIICVLHGGWVSEQQNNNYDYIMLWPSSVCEDLQVHHEGMVA